MGSGFQDNKAALVHGLQLFGGHERPLAHLQLLRHIVLSLRDGPGHDSPAAHGLLQAGVNIVYIRDILGHVDLKITDVYARADTEMKRKAMEQTYKGLLPAVTSNWNSDAGLMEWLHGLI